MKKLLFFAAIFLISTNAYGVSSNKAPFIAVISPRHGNVWCEGKTYTIKWKSRNVKKVCIEPIIGGHQAGILGNCNVDAKKGEYIWRIPKGFVSGFGINNANVKIYICNKDEEYCKSAEVLIKSVCVNPIRLKKKTLNLQ